MHRRAVPSSAKPGALEKRVRSYVRDAVACNELLLSTVMKSKDQIATSFPFPFST
ncbi:uncharacterized protein MYCFIDRAFT_178259 [Pseudocercospora fijiensis CIRAD86]|uniref:Uncharacterized protein n=1 Tax=Pseudocercospora fijiensis (strain CIRAD86) TaxID=383855 RepID=M3AQI4_PSEFD|nr:uncharacterized protein MYCFIDRAFT_178259 [Pseudocercospora fijiensis CIRAD86]EME79687.1 hypothetical protein MYCFIDRAFT_178259 [Pseudocercospora fijiensis CIRAD86]